MPIHILGWNSAVIRFQGVGYDPHVLGDTAPSHSLSLWDNSANHSRLMVPGQVRQRELGRPEAWEEPEGPGWLVWRDEEAEGNDTELKKERDTEVKSGADPPPCLGCSTGSMRGLPCHLAPTGVPAQGSPPAAGPHSPSPPGIWGGHWKG